MSLYIILFISFLSFTIIHASENFNLTELSSELQQELKEHSFIAFKQKAFNPIIIPHEINIISADNNKIKKRTLHDWNNVETIWINYSNTKIAPKKFCQKISLLAEKYNIKTPILPLTRELSKLDNFYCSSLRDAMFEMNRNIIIFNRNYTKQNDHPYLKFLLGHELSHRLYDNSDYKASLEKFKDVTNRCLSYQILKDSLLMPLTRIFINNSYIYYPLILFFSVELLSITAMMFMTYKTAKTSQSFELACDKNAIELFGSTTEEKIAVAQEGIEYFSNYLSTFHYICDRLEGYTNTFQVHPSHYERIQQLKKIIVELKSK